MIFFFNTSYVNFFFFFLSETVNVFWAEMWGGINRREDRRFSMYICSICFPHISCQTVTVTTLLLFGAVTLLCRTISLHLVRDLCNYQTVRSACPRSEILPLAASESFTQRRRWGIGARSPHPNGSVNGATCSYLCLLSHQIVVNFFLNMARFSQLKLRVRFCSLYRGIVIVGYINTTDLNCFEKDVSRTNPARDRMSL